MKSLENIKASGEDALPAELFKKYPDWWGPFGAFFLQEDKQTLGTMEPLLTIALS